MNVSLHDIQADIQRLAQQQSQNQAQHLQAHQLMQAQQIASLLNQVIFLCLTFIELVFDPSVFIIFHPSPAPRSFAVIHPRSMHVVHSVLVVCFVVCCVSVLQFQP